MGNNEQQRKMKELMRLRKRLREIHVNIQKTLKMKQKLLSLKLSKENFNHKMGLLNRSLRKKRENLNKTTKEIESIR